MSVVLKQPSEQLVYAFEFADKLPAGEGIGTIDLFAATNTGTIAGSANVTVSGEAIDGTLAKALIIGGTHGEDYALRCLITDTTGQKHEADATLRVLDNPLGIVVETGAVVAGANSYVAVSEADAYLRLRARAADWDGYGLAAKQGYLIEASAYLDAHATWRGSRVDAAQSLAWPRAGVVDRYGQSLASNAVPAQVRAAVIEIAAQGSPQVVAERVVESESVGPISVKYAPADPTQGAARYRYALRLIDGLVAGDASGSMIRVARA